jgi:hypothetical protein
MRKCVAVVREKELPSPEQQSLLLRALHADYRYPHFDPGYHSAFRIQGIPVDLWHTTIAQGVTPSSGSLIGWSAHRY